MKKTTLRITALLLSLVMLFSFVGVSASAEVTAPLPVAEEATDFSYLTNPDCDPSELSNAVVVPGLFQSCVRLYNDDGTLATNSDGEVYEGPFFLESTGDIVKFALKKALLPLLLTLITQKDWGNWLTKSVGDALGAILGGKVASDANGNFLYNVKADYYDDCVANLSQEDKDYIYDQIPLADYAAIAGEDHLYFFSYVSFDNLDRLSAQLYDLVKKAANASPTGKTNIVPISQGGSLFNALINNYPDVGQYLDRVIFIVPALDGSTMLGEIFEKGFIDDNQALYKEIFPVLLEDDDTPFLGDIVNLALRILPNDVVNSILDNGVDQLIEQGFKYSTCMWGLVPSGNYKGAADKYLNTAADAVIRAQTDKYYQAQVNSNANITKLMNDYSVEVFDIVDYNSALYPLCDSWKSVNADGIIQISSTSMGATSVAVDKQLPAGYVPAKGSKYVDKYNLVDAGTGLLPDNTFYFHNQNHESTARNDVILKLAVSLMTDYNFTSIDSYPDRYPQFNEGRNSRDVINMIARAEAIDTSTLDAATAAALDKALAAAKAEMASTVVSPNFDKIEQALRDALTVAQGGSLEKTTEEKISDAFTTGFTKVMSGITAVMFNFFGGRGFSDIVFEFVSTVLKAI